MKYIFFISIFFIGAQSVSAQTLTDTSPKVYKAEIIGITRAYSEILSGTQKEIHRQELTASVSSGPEEGKQILLFSDTVLYEVGDTVYVQKDHEGMPESNTYIIRDVFRWNGVIILAVIFIVIVSIFSGIQGLRSLLSLVISFALIGLILVPGLLKGYSPVLLCGVVAVLIVSLAMYLTHGFKRTASIALGAAIIAIVCTFGLAQFAVWITQLTGYASDEAVYLNFSSHIQLNFVGLLLGAIVIGVLGVLDDVSITQVSLVEELKHQAPTASFKSLYTSAMRVGREHVSALVNTLSLAYIGSSLPLVLLFSTSTYPATFLLNNEIFVTEIVRTVVGSIGLIITVPLATLGAIWFAKPSHHHGGHHH